MEDKLKLAEIKGYLESCLNKFEKAPTNAPYTCFYKDLNTLLDIVMDTQSIKKEVELLKEETSNKIFDIREENIELTQDKNQLKIDLIALKQQNKGLKELNISWQKDYDKLLQENKELKLETNLLIQEKEVLKRRVK